MGREHHEWRIGEVPPPIRAHSLAKHRVLKSYLERYVSVLTTTLAQTQFKLTLVDGFAGGGKYRDEKTGEDRPGSPMIMLNAMRDAQNAARSARRTNEFNLDVEYFFVEKKKQAVDYLRQVITESEYRPLLSDRVRLQCGDFVQQAPEIVRFIQERTRTGRAIFVLDQCGYLDAPLDSIRTILQELPNAEVILTIATDFLIDYLNDSDETQARMQRMGMILPSNSIRDAKFAPEWRRIIQFLLHKEIPQKTGAAFYTPFFIRSVDAHRDFWLVHLSGHYRARDVMAGLHWQECTSFAHYGRAGLRMLGYDPTTDQEWTKQSFLPGFYFDEQACAASREELFRQLPERLHEIPNGITFKDFFVSLTNESPVTLEIMKSVLNDLANEGAIEVRDRTGTTLRRAGIQQLNDIIRMSRQTRFLPLDPSR